MATAMGMVKRKNNLPKINKQSSMQRETVFIDTNLFIEENYFHKGNKIMTLLSLAKKNRISLITTIIVKKEVEEHFTHGMKKAFDTLKEVRELKNIIEFDNCIKSLDKKMIKKKSEMILKDFFDSGYIYIIGYEYCNNIEKIFDRYFNHEKPFGEGKKKNEFPDAFSLSAIESYCEKFGLQEVIVLSKDKDIIEYKSKFLKIEEAKEFISSKLKENEELEGLENELQSKKEDIIHNIEEELTVELDDESLYYPSIGYADISNIHIEINNIFIHYNQYYIESTDDDYITFTINPTIDYKITVNHQDLDYGYYDREDNVWYGEEWRDTVYSNEIDISVQLQYNKANQELEITDINYDNITAKL